MKSPSATGFSLIELIAVVAIVGILAAIAYPSYREAVRKSKRAEAKSALARLMQQQERYYSRHGTYIAFSSESVDEDERQFQWFSGATPASSAYEIRARACTGERIRDCVTLAASPGTAKVDRNFSDPHCGTLTFSSTGVTGADNPDCWR